MRNRFIYIVLCVLCFDATTIAQSKIEGIVNTYTKVTSLTNVGNQAVLQVYDVSGFKEHDTVLLIQMTGVRIDRQLVNNAGKYEFHLIASINVSAKTITLRMPADFNPTQELVQLIRVPSYKNAEVIGKLTCKPWNYLTGTGGVLAVMTEETLTIAADIDVSSKGFNGGKVTPPVSPDVLVCNPPYSSDGYPDNAYLTAGNKGEGFLQKSTYDASPRGRLATSEGSGGGGGNGVFAGGGGGGNGGDGGIGGYSVCGYNQTSYPIARGGKKNLGNSAWDNRIFMGGGGGTGTGNGTNGGNGGGIVILIAKKIAFKNNAKIAANGESVSGTPNNGGAGGGGAGGSVLFIADEYANPSIEINGGNGGNTQNSSTAFNYPLSGSFGTGGGGGGGMVFVKQAALNNSNILMNRGEPGNTTILLIDQVNPASPGTEGSIVGNHELQQKGFLYNFIISSDTILCKGDTKTISASQPQGGISPYIYKWLSKKGKRGSWEDASGTSNGRHYTTPPISDTVFFKRVVNTSQQISGTPMPTTILVKDTSYLITIIALPAIENNTLTTNADTTFCENVSTWHVRGLQASAAKGDIAYQWQQFNAAASQWANIDGVQQNYETSAATPGAFSYQRIALNSYLTTVCTNTSTTVKATIVPKIEHNELTANQNLCEANTPASLKKGELAGGDGNGYLYQWLISENGADWVTLPDVTEDLLPKNDYTGDRYYQRIVTSDCCSDTSSVTRIHFDKTPSDAIITNHPATDILQFEFNTTVEAAPISNGIGTWKIDGTGSFSGTNVPNSRTVTGLDIDGSTTITWAVNSENGYCPEKSAQTIITVKDVTIPGGFSPNNDQINDCFFVLGSENAKKFELAVVNRNNKVVFQTSSLISGYAYPSCLWEGKDTSGNELPAGTYFYRLTLTGDNNKQYKKTGYVTLKK